MNSGFAQGSEFQPVPKSSTLSTTELLMRAQAMLVNVLETGHHRRAKRRLRQHSPSLSYRSDSSQSSHFSNDKDQLDMRDERLRRHRRRHRPNDDVVRFKVGSATPEPENVESEFVDDDDEDEELVERLREMDVTDLIDQRDVLTRQIVTSLVALHQLNQELDRRRRRKSYSTFRKKDVVSSTLNSHQTDGNETVAVGDSTGQFHPT